MSEETAAASAAPETTTEAPESTGYIPPEDADEFVPTKWQKTPPEESEGDPEDPELSGSVEDTAELEEDVDSFLQPDGQMIKMKIDGKELDMPIEKVIAQAQKFVAGEKRMQEAAVLKKQVVNLMHGLKTNPFSVLARPEFGLDESQLRQKAEEWLYDKVQYESMSDEERSQADKLRELDQLKEQKEEWEAQKKTQERKAYEDMYSTKIQEALDASDLPKKPQVIKRIAFYLGEGLRRGTRLDPKDVIPHVRQELIEEYKALTSDEKGLSALVDADTAKALQKKSLEGLKKPNLKQPLKQGAPQSKSYKPKQKMSLNQWRERNKAILHGED